MVAMPLVVIMGVSQVIVTVLVQVWQGTVIGPVFRAAVEALLMGAVARFA